MGAGGRMSVEGRDFTAQNSNRDPLRRVPTAKPPFTLGEIKKAIPPHCFNRSLVRSFSFVFQDLAIVSVLLYLAIAYLPLLPAPLRLLAWPLYWAVQGCVMTGIWVIAHECGHHAFSDYSLVDDIVGLVLHSALFVPYFSWKYSHRRHHSNTGSLERDEVFVPKPKSQLAWFSKYLNNPPGRFLTLFVSLTIGWPLYLAFNVSGRPYDSFACHFDPYGPIYSDRERLQIFVSDAGILAAAFLVYRCAAAYSLAAVVSLYGVPLLVVNGFLVLITYLQHTHPALPHYNSVENCIKIFVEVRASNIQASLNALDLQYLEISPAEFNDVQSIEGHISQWGKHLEFAVKHLFEAEYRLCCDVFEQCGPPEVWTGCFAEIAKRAGILAFLQFGRTVADSKKDPIKLLKLLDIFASLNKLRLDFNRLFGCKPCEEIQNATRDLIKKVIDGACEIFWELLVQVELQREMPPPADGNVPRLVSFMTDYCNRLLGEEYRTILTQVLIIHRSWKKQKFLERHLTEAVLDIIRALEQNLQVWSKAYEDATLSHVFLMNAHWHLYKHLKGTKVGELLGEAWLREHDQCKEFYAASYLKETWAKLPGLLSREGLILFSGGRATARDLVKKRLRAFNGAFDEMHRRQSGWVIPDKDLREKICHLAVQAIVPVYRSYMQNYGPLVEQDASAGKYAKYTAQSLEDLLGSLFQLRPGRSTSFKPRHSNENLTGVVAASQYKFAPTVA